MSFFRKVAGAFIELNDEPQPAQQNSAVKPQTQTAQNTKQFDLRSGPSYNAEMVATLTAVSMNRKTAYTTFIEASKKLEAVIPDETTRIKAAFVTVSGEGRSLDQMLQAIDVHISDVESEKGRFAQASQNNLRTQVGDIQYKSQALLKENDEIASKIASLQEQIAGLSTKSQENSSTAQALALEADENGRKIESVKSEFTAAAEYVQQNLAGVKSMLASMITR